MDKATSPGFSLAKYSGVLSSPIRILILKKMAATDQPLTELLSIEGFTAFTIKQNLKYLKKYGLITGDLTIKHLRYSLDLNHLTEFKTLIDEWFSCVIKQSPSQLDQQSKPNVNSAAE